MRRPNILFCIADDAAWLHFGAYGCQWVSTPVFDSVAARGVLFENCYTECEIGAFACVAAHGTLLVAVGRGG